MLNFLGGWGYNKPVLIIERMLMNKAERQGLSLRRLIYRNKQGSHDSKLQALLRSNKVNK